MGGKEMSQFPTMVDGSARGANNHSDNVINYSLGSQDGAWERKELGNAVTKVMSKSQEGPTRGDTYSQDGGSVREGVFFG